ncbi:MAG: GAF domain-containing protein [Gammaproteobacteria bacterium]
MTDRPRPEPGPLAPATDAALVDLLERRLQSRAVRESIATAADASSPGLTSQMTELERRLDSLVEATRKTQESLSLDLLLTRLMALISEAFGADRSTLFLFDAENDQLFSRIAQGSLVREIRFDAGLGIAGSVFRTGEPAIIADAYEDPRFNRAVDRETGYRTRSILCVPVRTRRGDVIGVAEVLNKEDGQFSPLDVVFLRAFTTYMASAIENAQLSERARDATREEAQLMEVTRVISSELDIDRLLRKIMNIATELLEAERSTLFVHDPSSDELWSRVAQGLAAREIRIPSGVGIAGEVFTSRQAINIPDAYADARFNPEIDRRTGFRTRSILCVPVINKHGVPIGVVQVLNRQGGAFSNRDQRRLEMLAAQSAIALENARLFHDVVRERNYTENVLRRLTDGVVTVDIALNIVRINDVAARLLGVRPERVLGATALHLFRNGNSWVRRSLRKVMRTREPDESVDMTLKSGQGSTTAVNLKISPLLDPLDELQGYVLVFEDISNEKRVRSAMARYMTREVAEQVLTQREAVLGGRAQLATVMFSDVANFASLTETLGAAETVAFLNEYFTDMVEVIFRHGGILDKYIGDAIMAVFGAPFVSPRDADNAMHAALGMVRALTDLNARRARRGQPPVDIRIGLNAGQIVAGNIGSTRRMDYTVIGDGVNLASRLESVNRHYGTRILVSGPTLDQLQDTYRFRELDWIRVKGMRTPVSIHELLDDAGAPPAPAIKALTEEYAAALVAYRARQWGPALTHLDRALATVPGDGPSRVLRARVSAFRDAPPPADWDGVWTLTDK